MSRLAEGLAQREERMGSPKEWVSIEAKKRQALQEGGTLRYMYPITVYLLYPYQNSGNK